VAERLLKNVRKQEFNFGGEVLTVTISIGCAGNADVVTNNPDDLVKAADIALYEAKKSGRNRFVLYRSSEMVLEERPLSSGNSLPAPAPSPPFPASLPAPAGPFPVSM